MDNQTQDPRTRAARQEDAPSSEVCSDRNGAKGPLPACAPLASAYVPPQPEAEPRYQETMALSRGTLFPGLDLPFLDQVNSGNPYAGTPLGELMALDFVYHEMHLYLDTHPEDREAFQFLQKIGELLKNGRKTYSARYGPLCPEEIADFDSFLWTAGPWPWAFDQKGD